VVARFGLLKTRRLFTATIEHMGAPGLEAAPAGGLEGVGGLARIGDPFSRALDLRVRHRDGGEKGNRVRVKRVVIDVVPAGEFHDFSGILFGQQRSICAGCRENSLFVRVCRHVAELVVQKRLAVALQFEVQ